MVGQIEPLWSGILSAKVQRKEVRRFSNHVVEQTELWTFMFVLFKDPGSVQVNYSALIKAKKREAVGEV